MNVFDFAMNIERSGSQFYGQMANRVQESGPKTIFRMVAKDEKKLINKFRDMKNRLGTLTMEDSKALDRVTNPFEEPSLKENALQLKTDLEAYAYVIGIEKQLCRLFENAARQEPDEQVKALLLKVAEEEKKELESLRSVRDFVNAPDEYLAWGEFSNIGEFHNFGRDEG